MWVLMLFIWGASPSMTVQEFSGQGACQRARAIAQSSPNDPGAIARAEKPPRMCALEAGGWGSTSTVTEHDRHFLRGRRRCLVGRMSA